MAKTKIEWTTSTWNPLAGCSVNSSGCINCYAMRMAARLEAMGHKKYIGLTKKVDGKAFWTGEIRLDKNVLTKPLEWKTPQYIFVNSMSDLFHENVSDQQLLQIWEIMKQAHWHTFQVLTKRATIMSERISRLRLQRLENLWLGVSVENSCYLKRIDILRETPATVRVVSFEPLIGRIGKVNLTGIHWAIVGGESGPQARPLYEEWVDEIHEQCRKFGTAFFFKQWGGVRKSAFGRQYKGRLWSELPALG